MSTPEHDLLAEEGLDIAVDEYLDAHWDEVLADIDALVSIESVEDLASAREGAPFGEGPRRALAAALGIAARMGLDAHDCDGYIGFADLPGKSDVQLGIIGHVDVVPAGPGWSFEPYRLTRKDGYVLGRGVTDDKGPLVIALHAVKFWADRAARAQRDDNGRLLPYTIRMLFGANEETSMGDVAYYRARFEDPAFLFTPDAEFPVGYGEAGICSGKLESAPLPAPEARALVELAGGVAVNAVPGEAYAVVRAEAMREGAARKEAASTQAAGSRLSVRSVGDGSLVRIEAHGKSAHASTPELGESAIALLVDALLDRVACAGDELAFLRLLQELLHSTDGSAAGVAAQDEHFGALTMVGGMIALSDDRVVQTFDFRYPTTTSADHIEQALSARASEVGAAFVMDHDKQPFLMNPDGPAVQALIDAYNQVTQESTQPFTMKGGTYARMFSNAASFGPDKPWVEKPSWVGSMHGPNEGTSEKSLREAFKIYALAIGKLMQIEW